MKTNTEKIRILTEMRELIVSGKEYGFCPSYARAVWSDRSLFSTVRTETLADIGLYRPNEVWSTTINIWYNPRDKATRLQKIDEAINKFNNTMNKNEIKTEIQSIEESMKKDAERLNALRLEMDKPEKPTLEEMCKGVEMYFLKNDGNPYVWEGFRGDGYLSRERAEKEKLRIKLSVIADYFNGGLFEPSKGEKSYFIVDEGDKVSAVELYANSYGLILFKTRKHAELAMTYFSNDELIQMLR